MLVGFAYDRLTDRSELAIIDTQPLRDIASVKLPHPVSPRISRRLGTEHRITDGRRQNQVLASTISDGSRLNDADMLAGTAACWRWSTSARSAPVSMPPSHRFLERFGAF